MSMGYLELSTGKVVQQEPPKEFLFVRGRIHEGRFVPEGEIEGGGELGGAGQPGWMELADGSFHRDSTARPPFPPYVRGFMTGGQFRPSSRKISY
ncbi:MAG: hypothetical protein HYZ28_18115 [Myxococcales bacterium]|nr:hypothetical protein [Myxococcales bacterium]